MRRLVRSWRVWVPILGGAAAVAAILVSLVVFGAERGMSLTATPYSDVIRFEAAGAASLEVRIFDLSGKELWSSGVVSDDVVDWDRTNTWGERLAYGSYLYSAQAWDARGGLLLDRTGKLALLPGDKVQLQEAPALSALPSEALSFGDDELPFQPKGLGDTGIFGTVGIGTSSPTQKLHVKDGNVLLESTTGTVRQYFYSPLRRYMFFTSGSDGAFGIYDIDADQRRFTVTTSGNVGIGTDSTTAKVTIQDSTGQDLIAAYNGSNRVFVVKNNGEVCADGAFYGASFNPGGADVAERINVSEWVDAGCVVEIDPEHPGFFRKCAEPYSRRVAGIISTSPGVILGNTYDEATDDWSDNRPVLAIAGRVPVKVSAENGAIEVGDLLVSSSIRGVAMKATDPAACVGAVVGKAMEPLETGTGVIVAQVNLR